jgi:hypothetical protein
MAKKTVFQEIDSDAVDRLGIVDGTSVGVPFTSSIETVLLTESEKIYDEIETILTTETSQDLVKAKKAFVLPGNAMPADRTKALLKEHKITVTNDYEKADCIITSGVISEVFFNRAFKPRKNMLLWEARNGFYIEDDAAIVNSYVTNSGNPCIFTKAAHGSRSEWSFEYESMPYNSYILTGLAINLADKIKQGELEVVDLKTVESVSATVTVLDDQSAEDLIKMLQGDQEERALAFKLLPNIKTDEMVHLVYNVFTNIPGYSSNRRNKDYKYWEDTNRLNTRFSHMSLDAIIKNEHESGNLCAEAFRYLEPLCRKEIHISSRELYNFKVVVKPEYKQYLKQLNK